MVYLPMLAECQTMQYAQFLKDPPQPDMDD